MNISEQLVSQFIEQVKTDPLYDSIEQKLLDIKENCDEKEYVTLPGFNKISEAYTTAVQQTSPDHFSYTEHVVEDIIKKYIAPDGVLAGSAIDHICIVTASNDEDGQLLSRLHAVARIAPQLVILSNFSETNQTEDIMQFLNTLQLTGCPVIAIPATGTE